MLVIDLPPPITEILPLLRSLQPEQKLHIIHELSDFSTTSTYPITHQSQENLAWEAGQSIFGSYHSRKGDLSQNAKSLVKQRIREKYGKNSD